MNNKIVKTFRESKFRLFQKIASQMIMLPIAFYSQYAMCVLTIKDINKSIFNFETIIGIGVFIGMFYLEYILIVILKDLFKTAARVDLYNDRFVGYTHFKKNIWVIKYDKIRTVGIANGAKLTFSIEDSSGNKYEMSFMMEYLQECMEYIVAQSKNIEEVDFGSRPETFYWKKSDDPII